MLAVAAVAYPIALVAQQAAQEGQAVVVRVRCIPVLVFILAVVHPAHPILVAAVAVALLQPTLAVMAVPALLFSS
jgi:hypothetical protein